MPNATQPDSHQESNSNSVSSILPSMSPEAAGADPLTEANQRIFSSLLEAFLQNRDEDDEEEEGPDDVVPAGRLHIAVGCERLTNEIIQLEKLRQSVVHLLAQHSGVPATLKGLLELLLEGYDGKIRDCEEHLDRLLEPNRIRAARCGILVDYFIG